MLSKEAENKLGKLDNTAFVNKCYEVILMRSNTQKEAARTY